MRQSADEPSVSTGTRKHVVLVTDAGPHGGLRDRLERFAAGGGPEEALVRVALPDQPNTPPAVIEIAGPNAVDPTVLASDLGVDSRAVQVYAVVEQLRWARRAGEDTTAGVALIGRVRRAAGLTGPAFERHWYDVHRPLAIEHHIGMRWYVQNVVRSHDHVAAGFEADGLAELGFESVAAFETQMYDGDAGRRIIEADVATFVGHAWMGLYRTYGAHAEDGRDRS
jgi:uncharacterized protein (TIGR02118 family)